MIPLYINFSPATFLLSFDLWLEPWIILKLYMINQLMFLHVTCFYLILKWHFYWSWMRFLWLIIRFKSQFGKQVLYWAFVTIMKHKIYLTKWNKTKKPEETNNKHETYHPAQAWVFNIFSSITGVIWANEFICSLIHCNQGWTKPPCQQCHGTLDKLMEINNFTTIRSNSYEWDLRPNEIA